MPYTILYVLWGRRNQTSHVVDLGQSSYGNRPNAEYFLCALARIVSIQGCEYKGERKYSS